jgi:hypothetical protein
LCRLAEAAGMVVASKRLLVESLRAFDGVARSMLLTEKGELMVGAYLDLPKFVIAFLW